MIIIMGESGSGKSSVEQELEKRGFKRCISHTTRKMRKGEKYGITYFYVTQRKMNRLYSMGKLIEKSMYSGNYYGLSKDQVTENSVAVIEPQGIKSILASGIRPFVVYLKISSKTKFIRMINRGDNLYDIEKRNITDRELFKGAEGLADYSIEVDNKSIEEIVEDIISVYKMI